MSPSWASIWCNINSSPPPQNLDPSIALIPSHEVHSCSPLCALSNFTRRLCSPLCVDFTTHNKLVRVKLTSSEPCSQIMKIVQSEACSLVSVPAAGSSCMCAHIHAHTHACMNTHMHAHTCACTAQPRGSVQPVEFIVLPCRCGGRLSTDPLLVIDCVYPEGKLWR